MSDDGKNSCTMVIHIYFSSFMYAEQLFILLNYNHFFIILSSIIMNIIMNTNEINS